jgi:predicted nuclease of predicted toxin-antitoxin system
VRFLVDQCVSRPIVERLRREEHDVLWITEIRPGEDDQKILDQSFSESRILLTEDWDFGELAIRFNQRALGVVIVALPALGGSIETIAETVAVRMTELGEGLVGKLTILEPGRVRQRQLPMQAPTAGSSDDNG